MNESEAFGRPGIAPTWTSSAKDLVITALGPSRLWATLGHGIVNEVYWPATGTPQIRDLGFIVAGDGLWAEVKREKRYRLETPKPYIPLPTVVHEGSRYRLTLEFLPDPMRDALLVSYRLEGEGLRLYPLLAPHLSVGGTSPTRDRNTSTKTIASSFIDGNARLRRVKIHQDRSESPPDPNTLRRAVQTVLEQ